IGREELERLFQTFDDAIEKERSPRETNSRRGELLWIESRLLRRHEKNDLLGQAPHVVDRILFHRGHVEPELKGQLGGAGADELPSTGAARLTPALGLLQLIGISSLQLLGV